MKRSGIALVLALVLPCAAFAQGGGGGGGGGGTGDLQVEALAARRPPQVQEVRLQHLRPLREPQTLRTRAVRPARRLLPRMQIPIQPRAPPMR